MRALRILVAAGLMIVGVMAFSVSSASAQAPHSADCGFSGLAGTADPFGPHEGHATGVESVLTDANHTDHGGNVLLDQDHGRYNFSGQGTCVINDGGPPRVANVAIASTGVYANTICGTGTASAVDGRTNAEEGTGAQDLTTVRENGVDLVNDVAYSIDFRAGKGTLTGTADHAADNKPGTISGVVNITPAGGNCANTDVQAFQVAGDFVTREN
jgi:hypothetical protein